MENFEIWAAVVAALASFVLWGLWYSPLLFGEIWMRETGHTEESLAGGNPLITFGGAFVLCLVTAVVFALFLGSDPALGFALGAGFSAGLCWVATSFGVSYLFERRSVTLWLINGGYHTVQFTLFGLILGVWP